MLEIMKSTIINTHDITGGATLAGYCIAQALNRYTDIETPILCRTKLSHDKNIDTILKPKPNGSNIFKKRIKICRVI